MIKAFVNFLRAICINKFVLVLEVIFVTGLFFGIFRFFTTLIGFGLFNTLFGGAYHYPTDGLLFFSIIYSIASVLTCLFFFGENLMLSGCENTNVIVTDGLKLEDIME